MTSKSKLKGNRFENQVVDALNEAGIKSERIPLSGSLGGKYASDVVIGTPDNPMARLECKNRESINAQFWAWLEPVDYLVLKRNHKEPLVVMPMDKWIELIKMARLYNDAPPF